MIFFYKFSFCYKYKNIKKHLANFYDFFKIPNIFYFFKFLDIQMVACYENSEKERKNVQFMNKYTKNK